MMGNLSENYTLKALTVEGGGLCASIFLPEDLLYFDGHFDEVQVLPGVVQVDWAIKLAYEHLDIRGAFSSIDTLKFMRIIRPNETITLNVAYDTAKNMITFSYVSPKATHSTGKVRFA